ncbi:signal peptidase II [Cellulomonas sp. URHD0024]|uniref:signal peptidase II n=1 Tax=Cellulomonas sp. URHD0024 TaxID=1302620 RepID=UPI0004062744|nr:signal peptidase II [Cellulomonas sp. URHD0024]
MPITSDDPAVASTANQRRRRLLVLFSSITVVVLVLDQLTKVWALNNLTPYVRRDLVGVLLGLELVRNPGAALSIATGMTWLLTLVAVAVIVFIVRASRRMGSRGWAIALGLLLGGALGNLGDRLFRVTDTGFARGKVVDFIAYWDFFVGNVADIAIVVAALMIVVLAATGVHIDGSRDVRAGDGATNETASSTGLDDPGAEDESVVRTAEPQPADGSTDASEQNA